jgi:hypothetical protein
MFIYILVDKKSERLTENYNIPMKERSSIDRRSGSDRRKVHDLDYFLKGGVERRSWKERRSPIERRKNWIRVSEWVSVYVGDSWMWKISA